MPCHLVNLVISKGNFKVIHETTTAHIATINNAYQQNIWPFAHSTLMPVLPATAPSVFWILGGRCTTPSHSIWGHHFVVQFVSTNVLMSNVVYFFINSWDTSLSSVHVRACVLCAGTVCCGYVISLTGGMGREHFSPGHWILWPPPSWIRTCR